MEMMTTLTPTSSATFFPRNPSRLIPTVRMGVLSCLRHHRMHKFRSIRVHEQVFPTSLSEVAFTLVFLLMLLLGYMIVRVEKEKAELKVKLLNATQTES